MTPAELDAHLMVSSISDDEHTALLAESAETAKRMAPQHELFAI